MVIIKILDHVERAYNGDDGQKIHDILLQYMKNHDEVALSFQGIDSLSSSFVNSALIPLLESFSFDQIKGKLRFISTNSQINEMIKSRFLFEVKKAKKKQVNDLAAACG